jgi:hypothetical protein
MVHRGDPSGEEVDTKMNFQIYDSMLRFLQISRVSGGEAWIDPEPKRV